MLNLNAIFAKFEKQFNRGLNRSGYLTPAEVECLINQRLATTMGPNTRQWVQESIASGTMNSRWTTLQLTATGLRREPGKR